MKKIIILYHADLDGFGSAYVVKSTNPEARATGIRHGDAFPEDMLLNDVDRCYIVDFSFPAEVMDGVAGRHPNIEFVVIDHHDTAPDIVAPNVRTYIVRGGDLPAPQKKAGIDLVMEVIGVNELTPNEVEILKLIGRRDVWDFSDPRVKPLTAALFMKCNTFIDLAAVIKSSTIDDLINSGAEILAYQEICVAAAIEKAGVAEIAGFKGLAVNTQFSPSETGNALATKSASLGYDPFGIVYYYDHERNTWSINLRSIGDFDVASIAKKFGGGGHKNAAGIKIDQLPFSGPVTGQKNGQR